MSFETLSDPVRLAVVVDSDPLREWEAALVQQLREAPFLELTLVALTARGRQPTHRRLTASIRSPVWSLYVWLDRLVFGSRMQGLVGAQLSGGPDTQPFAPEAGGSSDPITVLRTANLDVILWVGPTEPPRELLSVARFGLWRVRAPDLAGDAPATPSLRGAYEGRPLVTSLQVMSADDPTPRTLSRSYAASDPLSLHRNRVESAGRASALVLRQLHQLHELGSDAIEASAHDEVEAFPHAPPTNVQAARHAWRIARRAAAQRARSPLFREEWVIGYRRRSEPMQIPPSAEGFSILAPPEGRYYADPFLITHEARRFVFFEDYSYRREKAVISCVEIYPDSTLSSPRVALDGEHHLSYPFVFHHAGAIFMIPETLANRSVELYRARQFPDQWAFEAVLLEDIDAVDATLVEREERIWLFVATSTHGLRPAWNDLHIFAADSLTGPWMPHARNPVLSDIRCARPAGRIFRLGVELIRPGQNGARGYGSEITFNQITTLELKRYGETRLGSLGPEWLPGGLGAHTYNFDDDYEVVDGKRMRRKSPFR
jgi:hypothetical protein